MISKENVKYKNDGAWFDKFILSPDGIVRSFWDPILTCLIIYTGFFLPFKLTFYDDTNEPRGVKIMDLVVDNLFVVDLALNFISAYDDYDT